MNIFEQFSTPRLIGYLHHTAGEGTRDGKDIQLLTEVADRLSAYYDLAGELPRVTHDLTKMYGFAAPELELDGTRVEDRILFGTIAMTITATCATLWWLL